MEGFFQRLHRYNALGSTSYMMNLLCLNDDLGNRGCLLISLCTSVHLPQFDDLLKCSSQVAFQQADFAGWNLWAAINDRPLLPFRLVIKEFP